MSCRYLKLLFTALLSGFQLHAVPSWYTPGPFQSDTWCQGSVILGFLTSEARIIHFFDKKPKRAISLLLCRSGQVWSTFSTYNTKLLPKRGGNMAAAHIFTLSKYLVWDVKFLTCFFHRVRFIFIGRHNRIVCVIETMFVWISFWGSVSILDSSSRKWCRFRRNWIAGVQSSR